jgi:hypothetical protein
MSQMIKMTGLTPISVMLEKERRMVYRTATIVVIMILVGIVWWLIVSTRSPVPNTVEPVQEQVQDERLRELLRRFKSPIKNERLEAQQNILTLSRDDLKFRNSAIRSLLDIVETQKGPVIHFDRYQEWKLAVETLGLMRAVEASSTLAKRISVNNGSFGLGIVWFPAATALVQIGDPAIPELTNVLRSSQSELERHLCVETLHAIRTPAARNALENIQLRTKRKDLKQAINHVLRNW